MLIRRHILEAIATGRVQCAFRRWERPTVKTGGTLKTAIGLLRIDRVAQVSLASISAKDAQLAGYEKRKPGYELSPRGMRFLQLLEHQ